MSVSKYIVILLGGLTLFGCNRPKKSHCVNTLYVSILPIRNIVNEITAGDFEVEVLVPAGASPETYEPTPLQMVGVSETQIVFVTGLIDFEKELVAKIADNSSVKIVDLSTGIDLIEGQCHNGMHGHGVDPHIWSSPKNLKQMARTACAAVMSVFPDSIKYSDNLQKFEARLDSLDSAISTSLISCKSKNFIIYHPALTYYAKDYGLTQTALEEEGKEPSAERLKEVISNARRDGISTIFYQKQFSPATVQSMAAEIGAKCVEIDPLREDVIENLSEITAEIAAQ